MRKKATLVLLILACLVLAGELVEGFRHHRFDWITAASNDFIEYWSAGQLMLAGGNPYDFQALYAIEREAGWQDDVPLVMWNPPWVLVLMLPFILLPFKIAAPLWLIAGLGILLACGAAIWRFLAPRSSQAVLAASLSLTFLPALIALRMGQISPLVLLGVVGFLAFAVRGQDIPAGAFLALTTAKPHVVYLFLLAAVWWVATRKRWKIAIGLAGAMAGLLVVISLLLPSWPVHYLSAWQQPPAFRDTPSVFQWRTPTIGGVLRNHFGPEHRWLQFAAPAFLLPLTLISLSRKGENFDWREAASPLLLASVSTAAYGWSHDLVLLLVPYLQVVCWLAMNWRWGWRTLAVPLSLLGVNGAMYWQNQNVPDGFYFFWAPFAWVAVYVYARRTLYAHRAEECRHEPKVGVGLASPHFKG